MRFLAKIQSVSDLITNSSSELFVVTSQSMPAVDSFKLLAAETTFRVIGKVGIVFLKKKRKCTILHLEWVGNLAL